MRDGNREDLCLDLIDSYYLDSDKHFFIFELEYSDMTLNQFIQRNQLSMDMFIPILEKIIVHFASKHSLQIQYQSSCYQFYVNIINSHKIEIKINLIDINIQQNNYTNQPLMYKDLNQSPKFNAQFKQENNIILAEEKKSLLLNLRNFEIRSQFLNDLYTNLNDQIEKKCFTDKMQHRYKKMLKFHTIEVFKIIQQHPMYDTFQVYSMGEKSFELIIDKRGKIIRLKGETFNSLKDAEQRQAIYDKLILKNASSITQSELIITEERFYVLTEKINIQGAQKMNNLNNISSDDLIVFYAFIDFCYQMLVQNDIIISQIDPQNIFLHTSHYDEIKQFQNEIQVDSFMIEEYDQRDFSQQYIQIFKKFYNFLDYKENEAFKQDTNLQGEQFFKKLNEKSTQDLSDIYNSIKIRINNIISIKSCNLYPQFTFKDFNKLSIKFQNNSYITSIMNLLKSNKVIKISALILEDKELFTTPTNQSTKYQYILNNNFNSISKERQQKLLQLKKYFQIQQSEAINCQSNYLFQFLEERLDGQVNIQFQVQNPKLKQLLETNNQQNQSMQQNQNDYQINLINQVFNISSIINQKDLSQNDINLMNNLQFLILNIQLSELSIKIILTSNNIIYLVGNGPYIVYKPWEIQQIEDLFQLEDELAANISIFGHNYIGEFKQIRHLSNTQKCIYYLKDLQILSIILKQQNFQFNLQAYKQIQQLNLIMNYNHFQTFSFKKFINQIQLTSIRKIKLILIHENTVIPIKIKQPQFYKLKRLVSFKQENKPMNNGFNFNGYNQENQFDQIAWSFDMQF
ncbi:hypothetical protein ABPG74_007936 [Tetrahymena malaccensis]